MGLEACLESATRGEATGLVIRKARPRSDAYHMLVVGKHCTFCLWWFSG